MPPSLAQNAAGTESERTCLIAFPTELHPVATSPLEVVAEHLLVLADAVARLLLEPVRVPLVELSPVRLRRRVVRRVANQRVCKPKAVVAGEVGSIRTDQLLAHEREQTRTDVGLLLLGGELSDCAAVEAPALDRGSLDDRPVGSSKPVNAGREERP